MYHPEQEDNPSEQEQKSVHNNIHHSRETKFQMFYTSTQGFLFDGWTWQDVSYNVLSPRPISLDIDEYITTYYLSYFSELYIFGCAD